MLVARHENEIGGTTDVATTPEFAARRTTKTIDGVADHRLVHRGLHARRAQDPAGQGAHSRSATRQHGLQRAVRRSRPSTRCSTSPGTRAPATAKPVGVYPETKHPTYFDSIGLSLEEPLLTTLAANGMDRGRSPVFIQSFETANLQRAVRRSATLPLVQLINCSGAPYDLVAAGDPRTYADLVISADRTA